MIPHRGNPLSYVKFNAVLAQLFKPRERQQNLASSSDLWKQGMQASNFGPGKSRGFINNTPETEYPVLYGEAIKQDHVKIHQNVYTKEHKIAFFLLPCLYDKSIDVITTTARNKLEY